MTEFVSRPAFLIADLRLRRRAPAWRPGRALRAAASAWLRARARRRDYARLADMPDELLEDAGLLRHPEIVRQREQRAARSRDLFGAARR